MARKYKVTVTIILTVPDDDEHTANEIRHKIHDGVQIPGYMVPSEWDLTQTNTKVEAA